MRATSIIRKVDNLGRVVLPIEIRRKLDISLQDELEIFVEGDRVILQKFQPSCIFCACSKTLVSYHGKTICQGCIQNIRKFGQPGG